MKLEKLTQKQLDAMPTYVDKWVKIGLSTERVDFDLVKKLVGVCYTRAGLPIPQFHFAHGPNEGYEVYRRLGGQPGRSEYVSSCMLGSMEAAWLSYYDFYSNETDIDFDNIDYMKELVMSSGWVYFGDTHAIIHDRPTLISRDDQNRLHSETGPSVQYKDGWETYFWHGVCVPKNWIMDRSSLTAEIALSQQNTELRRSACEILGWINILESLNAIVIDQDEDDTIGTLYEVALPEMGKERFLKVRCGTGRMFAIPVPPTMRTALEANAWTYDMPAIDYAPEVRT